MPGLALGDDLSTYRAHDLVAKTKRTLTQFRDVRPNNQFVVVIRGRFVAAIRLCHDEKSVVVLFHVAVRKTARPTIISAAYFEPDEIVGIINDAHLVRFGIADA